MNGKHAGVMVPREALHEAVKGTVAEVPSYAVSAGVMGSTGTTYRFEFNTSPTILARVWEGTTTVFSVDTSGAVVADSVVIQPMSTSTVPLTIFDFYSTSANWTEWRNSSNALLASVDNTGEIVTGTGIGPEARMRRGLIEIRKAGIAIDSQPTVDLDGSTASPFLYFGPGGATAPDTNVYRSAANVLKTDDQFIAVDGAQGKYISGAGKVAAADGDFTVVPANGMTAVVFNTTDSTTRFSVRANGTWHTTAAL